MTTTNKPKVIIGCNYQPKYFERRTSDTYSALMPAHSRDAEMLQDALLAMRPSWRTRIKRAMMLPCSR